MKESEHEQGLYLGRDAAELNARTAGKMARHVLLPAEPAEFISEKQARKKQKEKEREKERKKER